MTETRPRQNRRRRQSEPVIVVPQARPSVRLQNFAAKPFQLLGKRLAGLRAAFVFLLRMMALAAMVVLFVAVGRLLERHVRTADSFQTSVIDVSGNERMTSEDVLQAAGLSLGTNVFEVSPEEAQKRLVDHPWIASAKVERRLPSAYTVHISEREPVAMLALDTLYLISGDGGVFKPLEEGDPADLPVVTGVDADAFAKDRTYRTRLLVNVVSLLHDYRDAGLFRREPISEIHIAVDEAFSAYVGEDATYVRLGRAPFRQKLRKFRKVLDRLRKQKARPAYVYLDNVRRPDRVTVRMR